MRNNTLHKDSWKYIGGICLIIFINSIVYFIFKDATSAGTFGDIFGLSNALFSGFALAGIIYTILLQQEDLNLQRKELRLTRREQRIQNETLKLQRFENTFFSMLESHQSILSYLRIETYVVYEKTSAPGLPNFEYYQEITSQQIQIYTNRDVFRFLHNKFHYLCLDEQITLLREAYYKLYDAHQDILGHYFRNLYRIIKLIDNTTFRNGTTQEVLEYNHKLRYEYTSILRAQFSTFELMLIFYNCLSDHGCDYFKPLIEKYTLLKNISNHVLNHSDHRNLYKSSAFFKST